MFCIAGDAQLIAKTPAGAVQEQHSSPSTMTCSRGSAAASASVQLHQNCISSAHLLSTELLLPLVGRGPTRMNPPGWPFLLLIAFPALFCLPVAYQGPPLAEPQRTSSQFVRELCFCLCKQHSPFCRNAATTPGACFDIHLQLCLLNVVPLHSSSLSKSITKSCSLHLFWLLRPAVSPGAPSHPSASGQALPEHAGKRDGG